MNRSMRVALMAAGICASVVTHSASIRAQTIVSEQEVLQAVGQQHPSMIQLQGLAIEARREKSAARRWENPTAWLERETYSDDLSQTKLGISVTMPIDGRRSLRGRAAEHGLAAAEADVQSAMLGLRQQVRQDFAVWYLSSERLRSNRSIRELAEELARMMQDRAGAGEASRLEASRMQAAATELRALEALSESEWLKARTMMNRWTATITDASSPILPELPIAPAEIDIGERADIVASANRKSQSEALARLSNRWLRVPSVDIGWIDQSQGNDGAIVGLSLELPLFDRNHGERAASQSRLLASSAAYESDTLRARLEWDAARGAYEELRAGALSQAAVFQTSDSIIVAATAAFRAGEMDITDLLETLRSVQASHDVSLELLAAALAAHRKLELAAGKPLLTY